MMFVVPVACDEAQHLAALRNLRVLDTLLQRRFGVLLESAARMLNVPIALDGSQDLLRYPEEQSVYELHPLRLCSAELAEVELTTT